MTNEKALSILSRHFRVQHMSRWDALSKIRRSTERPQTYPVVLVLIIVGRLCSVLPHSILDPHSVYEDDFCRYVDKLHQLLVKESSSFARNRYHSSFQGQEIWLDVLSFISCLELFDISLFNVTKVDE